MDLSLKSGGWLTNYGNKLVTLLGTECKALEGKQRN